MHWYAVKNGKWLSAACEPSGKSFVTGFMWKYDQASNGGREK